MSPKLAFFISLFPTCEISLDSSLPLLVFPHFSPQLLPFQIPGHKSCPRGYEVWLPEMCLIEGYHSVCQVPTVSVLRKFTQILRFHIHMFYYSVLTLHILRMFNWTKFSADPCSYLVCSSSPHLCCSSSSSSSPHSCSCSSHPFHCCCSSSFSPCSCSSSRTFCFQALS